MNYFRAWHIFGSEKMSFQFIEFRGGHMMPRALRKVIDLDYMQ